MGQRTKWKLPVVVSPTSFKCASINIPNDSDHIAAFQGAIYELTRWYAWQDDPDHTAKEVAAVWANAWENMTITDECGTPDTPWCGLSDFHDSGLTDNWSGITYQNDAPTYDAGNHAWRLTFRIPPAGINQFLVMQFHTVDPIHVTRARIGYISYPTANVDLTVALIIKGTDPTGALGYGQSSAQAPDFNGFVDTPTVNFTDTDFVIRVQQASNNPSNVVLGDLFLIGVNLYGDGPAPAGLSIC